MKILFTAGHFESGGTETLILRLAEYYSRLGHRVAIICYDIIDDMRDVLQKNKIQILKKSGGIITYNEIKKYKDYNIIISFGETDYISLISARNRLHANYVCLLYVVHPHTLTKWRYAVGDPLFSKIRQALFYSWIMMH